MRKTEDKSASIADCGNMGKQSGNGMGRSKRKNGEMKKGTM